jgi:hypothetical protein
MSSLILVATALWWAVLPLTAQQAPPPPTESSGDDIITGAALDPAICNHGNAARLSIDTVLQSATPSPRQCVSIDGYWSGRALFRTAAEANSKFSNSSKRLAARRIGMYGSERLLVSAPKRATRYTLVGQLRRCETAWPGAMMVMGYCHYTGGPFLIAAEARLLP